MPSRRHRRRSSRPLPGVLGCPRSDQPERRSSNRCAVDGSTSAFVARCPSVRPVARLVLADSRLILRLNALEKVAALRRSVAVPIAAVESVDVVYRPWREFLPREVAMGFAASTAPGRSVVTAGPRARTTDGGEAVVFVYFDRPAVVVRTRAGTQPRLMVVSTRSADDDAQRVRKALAR